MRKILILLLSVVLGVGQLAAQTKTISGKVTDATGSPLPNVSVVVKGSTSGTSTKLDGTYTITVPSAARALVFSSVGLESVEVAIGSKTTVNATLSTSTKELTEVIVQVPYGTVKKTSFTGSEATVTTKSLEKQQLTSVTKALEGLVPGIITTNGGGDPGSGASILIRGVGSVNASSSPLYVLNGVPYDGSISALSMDDIESVTVLKDAAAAALYGSRAANGVIMITTKKGKRGKTMVNATVRQGFMSRAIPEYDRIGPKDFYEVTWEALRNNYVYNSPFSPLDVAGQQASNLLTGPNALVYNAYNVPGNQLVDPLTGKLNPSAQLLWNDSWEDALYRTADRKNYNVSFSGGSERTDYFFSAGYLDEEGIVKFSGYKRYNARLNLNTQVTDWLKAGLNIDGSMADDKNVPSGGTATTNPFYYTRQMGPIYPVWQRDASGNFIFDPATGGNALDWGRPDQMGARPYAPNSNLLGSLDLDDRNSKIFNGNANSFVEVSFLKNFTFKTTLGVNYWDNYQTSYQNSQFGDADNVNGRSTKTIARQVSYTFNEVLTWSKTFGEHSVRVLAGHENYQYRYNNMSATKINFPFPGTSELDNAAVNEGAGSYEDLHRIEGYFANANYEFANKYMLSGSYRRDGTSRFFKDKRWGNFFSAGVGWRITQEEFMKNVDWLNELKLRASYGEQGNESIGTYYAWQNLYDLGWNNANRPGGLAAAPPNPDLIWETNKTMNVGFDFAVFSNRLTGTVEYFNRVSSDLLFGVKLPPSTGNTEITRNIGEMKNSGIEVTLGYNAVRTKNFDWRIDLNVTHFKNEITKMPPGQPEIVQGGKQLKEGNSIYDFWIREYAGVDASTGDALYYKDLLGADGKPNGQRTVTNVYSQGSFYNKGTALPDFTGGLTNSLRYKNFDLSFLLTFSYGGQFLDGNYQNLMGRGTSPGIAWHADILKRWQKPGDVTNVPRVQNALNDNEGTSTRYMFDASSLNIKNITLSYTFSKSMLSRMGGIAGLSIFANVDNAILFSNMKGMDPQRSFTGTSDWGYTPFRTVTIGLNANL